MNSRISIAFIFIAILGVISLVLAYTIPTPIAYLIIDAIMDIEFIGDLSADQQSQLAIIISNGYKINFIYKLMSMIIIVFAICGYNWTRKEKKNKLQEGNKFNKQ
jgi:hypothetical protein